MKDVKLVPTSSSQHAARNLGANRWQPNMIGRRLTEQPTADRPTDSRRPTAEHDRLPLATRSAG